MGGEAAGNNVVPTAALIAQHLDLSERRVWDVLRDLGINHRNESLDAIRIAYIRDLREKAAGRGGAHVERLNEAKIRESTATAQLRELEFYKQSGLLVPIEEIEPLLTGWAVTARTEFQAAIQNLVDSIESRHGITIDDDTRGAAVDAAWRAVGDYPAQLAPGDAAGGAELPAAGEGADAGVAEEAL